MRALPGFTLMFVSHWQGRQGCRPGVVRIRLEKLLTSRRNIIPVPALIGTTVKKQYQRTKISNASGNTYYPQYLLRAWR
ncbi:hypothetical protein LZ023_37980 (plasmid) [Pseudomonas silvicola]|nr:hypothetical protein LZ023_37980 [Pseudomonas silvicola]